MIREQLARDVLKQLDTGLSLPETGNYAEYLDEADDSDAKTVLETSPCTVCALGALFVADVRARDGLTVEEYNSTRSPGMRQRLAPFFPLLMLLEIEAAFEGVARWWYGHGRDEVSCARVSVPAWWGELTAAERMRRIMQYIVDHGDFDRERLYKETT